MKKYRIGQIAAGIIFFSLAIFFSFSLLFALFENPGVHGGFYGFIINVGHLLKNSYGICSILIPAFFFAVSMVCLILQITFKTCVYISFSLIPFFTAVVSEKIYHNQLHNMPRPIEAIKLILTVVATLLIMAIEFLASGIIAERLAFNRKIKQQMRKDAMNDTAESDDILYGTSEPEVAEASVSNDEYTRAFDNIPLYDEKDNFTVSMQEEASPEETENEEIIEDDFSDIDVQEELPEEEINEDDIIYDQSELENYENDYDQAYEEESVLDDMVASDDFGSNTEEADDPTMIETDLDATHGISDIFSQMDAEINARYSSDDESEDFDLEMDEDIQDQEELSPDEQFEQELAASEDFINENQDDEFVEPDFEENYDKTSEPEIIPQPEEPVATKSVKEVEAEIRQEKKASITKRRGPYKIPTDTLLNEFEDQQYWVIDNKTNEAAQFLKETLEEFKIAAEVTGIRKGPVVTMFEILPAPGVKLSKIVALQDNIALRLAASSVRIVAPIPGKRAVGIEVPNDNRATVTFRELIEQNLPEYKKMAVPVVLGKDIQGEAQLLDIAKTPHLLIAGSTGSGKSVCVNSIILSILYKRSPNDVKLILVDPKIVELKLYNDIPHLLTPVITEPKKALQSLQYCLCEMERRYALLDGLGVRDIINYNKRIEERHIATEKLPYIVVIIDEFADLMATTGKELESTIARLCAMSRAVGIHLVLATQRPSIDVITGLIKANIPTRIAFMVASKMDSRIIIDQVGAEKLLGKGDMLYASATDPFPVRIQGTFVSDDEVENVVEYVKGFGEPEYIDDEIFVDTEDDEMAEPSLFGGGGEDPLYNKALEIVMEAGKASASYLQRRLSIGYNRAARLIEDMEARGIVGPANGSKPREIIHMP